MSQAKLLCVDDSIDALAAYEAYFSQHGFLVRATTDPAEAISIATCECIDLAIVDYAMPVMDGGILAGELNRLADFPIIMVSGDLLQIPEQVRGSVDCLVSKQEGMRSILEIVSRLLAR